MERIDHVDVGKISGCRFISNVNGMLERNAPDGECLEFCISGLDPALILVIELGKTGSHLSGTGTGSGNDDELS